MCEVVGDFELDWDELEAADIAHQRGENTHPAARLAREDFLQCFPLRLTGPFVHEDPQRHFRILRPGISVDRDDTDHV